MADNPTPSAAQWEAAWARFKQSIAEIVTYARYYLELNWDQVKLKVAQGVLWALAVCVMGVMTLTLLIAGGIMLAVGLSQTLTQLLFDGNVAYGTLTAGAILTFVLLASVFTTIAMIRAKLYASLTRKYEHKKQQQRATYGHDVAQRAAGTA